jgi:predicted AAA+ superfamily ATPase
MFYLTLGNKVDIPQSELFSVLQEFNPWWLGRPIADLPTWERTAAGRVWAWVEDRQTKRSLLLTGPRQVGKTTIYRQTIRRLLAAGFPGSNIVYATFDHPLFKLAGLERTLQAWEELYPPDPSHPQFLFLDEVQFVGGWQTWLKHQVDFQRKRRIAATGSALALRDASSESGVGRWETIPLATMTFAEFMRLREVEVPSKIPTVRSLQDLFDWKEADFSRAVPVARSLASPFHDYLLRGGFPEPALTPDLTRCQRLLREDIVDKVLKRDMTALYGVRRIIEVEKLFLYLCYHDGGILDVTAVTRNLEGTNKQTVLNYLDLFEATHLIYRLKPYLYGKAVLRGKDKAYLADAALPGAMLLLGRKLLEQPSKLGAAVETAFFKHAFTRYYAETPRFSYWRGSKQQQELEVDLIARIGDRIVPFEVKYQDTDVGARHLKGLQTFMAEHRIEWGYVITRRPTDLRIVVLPSSTDARHKKAPRARVALIPAPLACLWLAPLTAEGSVALP